MRGFRGTRATLNEIAARYGRDPLQNVHQNQSHGPAFPKGQQPQRDLPAWIKAPKGLNAPESAAKPKPGLRLVVDNTAPKKSAASRKTADSKNAGARSKPSRANPRAKAKRNVAKRKAA